MCFWEWIVKLVKYVLERRKFIVSDFTVIVVINGNKTDIIVWKENLHIITCHKVVTSQTGLVFNNDSSDFALFDVRNHLLKSLTFKGCAGNAV
ncbi:MAG: hypothetical protein NC192_11220, partial [Muribaculaceae bacterium]|nr:hypothetical protein [Muribaculaceae bacterium]